MSSPVIQLSHEFSIVAQSQNPKGLDVSGIWLIRLSRKLCSPAELIVARCPPRLKQSAQAPSQLFPSRISRYVWPFHCPSITSFRNE